MSSKKKKNKEPTQFPLIVLVVGFMLILVAVFFIVSQKGNNSAVAINQDEIPRVSAQEAFQAQQDGQAVIVDVRSADAYNSLHATNAISIPLDELPARMGELDPHQWIITYCT